jgi:hypothetical protein
MQDNFMARTLARVAIAAGLLSAPCFGQDSPSLPNPEALLPRGIHIYGVSVYAGYSTSAYPLGGVALNESSALANLGADETYGATATIGWQQHGARTNLSVIYSGGYGGMVRYSGTNGMNHSLSLNFSRQLSSRWTASVSGDGADNNIAQFLFQPEQFSAAMSAPVSFEDFAAAFAVGAFSNAQIASMLTGSPILMSPARSLLLGDRVLSYSVQGGLSYAYSSRFHFHLSSFSAAGQARQAGTDIVAPSTYVMPRSTGANADAGFSYMLSPRTDVEVNGGEYMVWNHYQRVRGSSATVGLGRKMGPHWFLRLYAGGSQTESAQYLAGQPKPRQVIGGGSLGVKTHSHSLAGSYDRSSYDPFGFAAGTSISISGSWHWQRPGSRWSTFAGYGEQQLRNTGFASISGWQASGGIALRLWPQATASLQYAHMQSAGTYTGSFNTFKVDSIRVSLGWTPVATAH